MSDKPQKPKCVELELDSAIFTKIAKGKRNWLNWRGNGVRSKDYVLVHEIDQDTEEYTGRSRMLSVSDVQKGDAEGLRGILKGWALLSVWLHRPPRGI